MLKELYSYVDLLNFMKEHSKDFDLEKTFPLNSYNYFTKDGVAHFNPSFGTFIKDAVEVLGLPVDPEQSCEIPHGYRLFIIESKKESKVEKTVPVKAKTKAKPKE